ncbi:glycosyl transferase [Plectosphaerella plurivora]|uniref:Glycosyl transferase n=1 Tax=Plectosphaerella plurivora TaxID=936078 RepID=A0A9P8VJZ4_9PEZI|nr:glycosyl transferase [Plectosphaerella plurivora]
MAVMEDTEALLGSTEPVRRSWMKETSGRFVKPEWMQDANHRFIKPTSTTTRRILAAIVSISLLSLICLFLPTTAKDFIRHTGHPPNAPNPECPVSYVDALPVCKGPDGSEAVIPNIVHYVFLLKDPQADFPLQFSHFLSMYGAYRLLGRPDKIYLHTNVAEDSIPVQRARSGESGKWNKLIFDMPGLVINTVEMPETAGNGKNITMMEHKSDFIRVKMVQQLGGIYLDLDVQPLRDLAALRNSGYRAVGGREYGFRDSNGTIHDGTLNSGTFMSVAGGAMITRWMEKMNEVFDGGWITHSNKALTSIAEDLVADDGQCEMLVLGRAGFAPGSWVDQDVSALFDSHADVANWPDEKFHEGDPLSDEVNLTHGLTPDWAADYGCTYLLHAFSKKKARNGARNNGITPRYVLERKSNYARAVYPIARAMYNEGLVNLDDTDLGV